jgi:hypothetical protein
MYYIFIQVEQMNALHCMMWAAAHICKIIFSAEGPLAIEALADTNLAAGMIFTF